MAIDLQKSLDNVRKQMGTYKPTAADVGKIDLNKSLQNVKALQKQQQEMLERRRAERAAVRNKNLMEATQKMSEYQQTLNPTPLQSAEEVSTQRAASTSYPRLSIGERVGQTLAGLQEGTKAPAMLDSSSFTGVAAANSPKQIIQNRIDELKQRGQRTDENGVKFYQTEQGEKELRAAQDELAQVFYQLTGQYVKINSADDAEKLLNRLPEVPWGRWAQVDANAGQAMQAIADRQDAEQRGAVDEYYQKYGSLMEREDFSANSRYQSTATGEDYNPAMAMFRGSGFGDLMYDYINKNKTAVERQQLLDTSSGLSALGLDQSFLQTMTGDEVKIYNYLYATEGRDSANEYLQYIQNALTARQRQETQQWFGQYAQENPVKASALSTLLAPARGLAYLGQTQDLLQDGAIDQNAAYNKFADVPNTIRETVAENWGPTGSFLYQTGMSMADFLVTLGVSGGNSTLSMAIMGSGAAADTVIDAKDRGLTDLQAFTLGTIAGAAEALTEKVSIESLLDMTSLGKNAVEYVIKNALSEAGEEAASGIINTLTDIIISKDKSQWQQEVDRYFAQGMTKSQAVNLALMNQAKSIGLDALGGALSGGLLGGTVAGADALGTRIGEVNQQNRYLRENFQKNFAELPRVQREVQMETLLDPLRKEQEEMAKQWERQRQMERLLQPLRDGSVFEQGENRAVQMDAQTVDVIQEENQQANQSFAQREQQTQQTPVQSNVQAQTENVDIMETPVETQEPEENRETRALTAQYEANGGTLNGQQERGLPAADRQEWKPDQSAGEQAGGMGGGTIELESYANQGTVARSRQNRLRNIEAGRTNPEWLNLDKSRYDIRRIQTFPEEAWDGQMQRAAQRAFEKGVDVQFFAGTLRVGGTRVDGVNLGDGRILIQADSQQWSVDQLTDHELMHTYLAEEYGMRDEMIKKLETQDLERLNQMVQDYVRQYEGVIDLRGAVTDEEVMQRSFAYVIDEIICDAYAGMNRRGWGAVKFSETVRTTYENRLNGRDAAMNQDVRGPPMETRYSAEDAEWYDGLSLTADSEVYDYDFLTNLPDMRVLEMPPLSVVKTGDRVDQQKAIRMGMENASQIGRKVSDTVNAVRNRYTGREIQISQSGLGHSLGGNNVGRLRTNARLTAIGGSIVQNAVPLNALNSTNLQTDGTYAMAALLKSGERDVVAIVTVEQYTNRATGIDYVDVAHSINGRLDTKKDGSRSSTWESGATPATTSIEISIADFLEIVNNTHRSILSEDVLRNLGETKSGDGYYADRVKFSVSDEIDSEGNELSVEQAEYFADSVVRDENGRLMPMYHGTPNAGFTVFRSGSYFTPNREYAEGYRDPNASMLTRKRTADSPDTYAVYLNITKPFDTRNDAEREIFESEYYRQWGTGAPLADSGLPDWTDGMDLQEFIEEMEYDYDGLILDEGATGGYGEEVRSRGLSYVVFSPEQVKNIDNRTPTSDVDIRYSVAEETDEDVQMLETAEESARPEPERKRKRDAHTARKELRTDLMNLFSVPVGLRGEAGRAIDNYAQQIIERGSLNNYDRDALFDILHNYGEMTVPAGEYEQTLRGAVKGAKVYVPDGVKAEFGEAEDWNEFKREAFAAGVYFTSNQKDPAADEWNQELSLLFPGAFDENETDAAWILRQIVNVAEQGKSEKMTLAEYAASLADQYGPEVIDDYYANMERQMDQLLNSFADKARFENNLRERTENQLRRDADYRREQRERQRQTRHLRELQQKTLKQLQWLSKNRNKAPADLRKQFEEVLSDIDVFAVSAANEMNYSNKYGATWRDLKEMYLEAQKNDPNWLPSKDLDRIVSRLTDPKLEDFNYNELNDLYRAALGLRQELYNRRNLLNDNRMFEEVYDSSVKEISEAAAGYEGTKRDRLMNLQQLTPMNVIERMADWNPNSAWLSMGKQLEQGERDTKKFAIQSNKLLQEFIEKNQEWIETADGQGKDAVWYEYELPELTGFRRGDAPIFSDKRIKVYMTPAMKIQLFLESKSYDNLNHMLGGRRFADKDMYTAAKGDAQKRREAMAQGRIVKLTPEMVRDMVKDLTPQEMELANILGNGYYNGFAKQEINRVSNVLYGYDKAMSSWYTPIFTDQSFNKTEPGIYDATAEGAGNLKERVRMSTNPSLNLSAFDAFERSVSQTSKFVGMAIPVRNWNTLMNWRSKDDSMKNTIATKWGAEMQNYLDDVVVRLQNPNVEEKTVLDEVISGALSNYISAVFGLNPSVVAKQFGSFYMAIPYLGVENMPNPKQIHNVDPEIIAKYSPELDDRLMGYAIPEVSQLKEKPNWSQKNKALEFVAGGGAITAMDGWTAKTLWPWAENKVAKETGLTRGTDEFYRRVAVEFDNAIVRSQSINDVMHRSKLMNSKNAFTRAFTMFKTDSAQSYNMLREAFGEMQYAKKHGSETQKKAANKKAAYAVLGIAANNLWAAAITALINLWKAKGKNYRDEEGNLTLPSVAAQYAEDVLTSMAGIVIGGEEIADVIASLLGGDKFYGIEIAGGEQLSDIVDEIVAAGTGAKEILMDGYYILNNGGDLGEYLEDRGADLIGAAKEMAQKLAKYIAGLPVDNLEAYLVGTLRWAAPQAVAAYEDALKTPDKAGLKGLEGKALNVRMGNVLDDRMGGASDATVEELARLYAADLTDVVPPAEAEKIGEEALTADEQQAYRISLHNTLGMHLDEFVASERYQGMDDEAREQSLKWLYNYAKEIAKSGITGEDPETNVQRINELLDNGMAISEALAAYDEFTRANKLLEAGLEPELSADVAQAIHDKENENGPDVDLDNLERYEIMLDTIGNEITRYAAMAGLMPEKERARFQAGHDWVDSETYVRFLREWKTQYPEDDKSQDKVKKLLKEMDLDNDERAALWQMCAKNWNPSKNPFDRGIGKEIAAQIEASYAEIDGE